MSFDAPINLARRALRDAGSLGFDHLTVRAKGTEALGIRVAQSAVCRENIRRDAVDFEITGIWQGRRAAVTCEATDAATLVAAAKSLRAGLERQSPDRELVIPRAPAGRVVWEPCRKSLDELYGPELLYPLIATHAARVRAKGLRLTGYVEAEALQRFVATSTGTEVTTRDAGITLSFTVDDGAAGRVGTAQRAATDATPAELDALIESAVDEALEIAATSANPVELAPGDYTVVFHPSAVLDLLGTVLMYGLFDRRKIDEGRTYLSARRERLVFPAGLRLAQTLQLPLPNGRVYGDLPLNHRLVPCNDIELIAGGRVRDLHCGAYWAKVTGEAETFAPHDGPPVVLEATPKSPLAGRHATLQDLIRDTPRGLYVANTWYLRMVAEMDGTITGMTRDGLFEIEDGRLRRAVRHMRWHENPFRVLGAVTGLTDAKLLLGRSRLAGRSRSSMALMPGLRVEDFHFSSVTRF